MRLFIIQAADTSLSSDDLMLVPRICLVPSNVAAAIRIVLVLSIDWFIGMTRQPSHLIGNCVAYGNWCLT
ncbi:hypothetical protein [Rhodopila sp.]|uniref:hypothetical protein n=1 Tax=Rhodopila sp. TaxID=2480087 RepID=UPI003D0D970C